MEYIAHSELRPESPYRLRDLFPRYYMILGALAAVAETDGNDEWRKIYQERLKEIEEEIKYHLGVEGLQPWLKN